MVTLCCGIFFPSLTYVTPLYTTCHLFHENHPLDRDHDHLAVETLVCGVAPPQTLDQSCSCRDLPANDFLVLPFLICYFLFRRISYLPSFKPAYLLKCFCRCFCCTFRANPEPRIPWIGIGQMKKVTDSTFTTDEEELVSFQFNLSANIKWLCCSTAGRAKKEMAKTEKQEATILPERRRKNSNNFHIFSGRTQK